MSLDALEQLLKLISKFYWCFKTLCIVSSFGVNLTNVCIRGGGGVVVATHVIAGNAVRIELFFQNSYYLIIRSCFSTIGHLELLLSMQSTDNSQCCSISCRGKRSGVAMGQD